MWPETGDTDGKFAAPMDSYSWTRSIVPAAHSDAREVHVTVTWSSEGREEQVTLAGVAVK